LENVVGAAIRNLQIGPSLSNRIESERRIRIRIESGSFACPDQKATYAACKPRTALFSVILEDPYPAVFRSRHSLTLSISEYRHNFNRILIETYTRPTQ